MTATKVECREFGVDSGPLVEEVASYAYTVQEESSKSQNGVLIEEFSEKEEKRSNLGVNRGITIVSVSDDESTLKALSRDVSTEDMQAADLPEDQRATNDVFDDLCFNGTPEDIRLHRVSKITEIIVEERSPEEPSSAVLSNQTLQRESLDKKKANLPSQNATISDMRPAKKLAEETAEQSQSADIAFGDLSKEIVKHEKTDVTMKLSSETLSRQSSLKALLDDDGDEIDEDMKNLLARVKRQRSELDEILDKESSRESGTARVQR